MKKSSLKTINTVPVLGKSVYMIIILFEWNP